MTQHIGELNPPTRLMMTPGPCSIDPRVYRALASPIVGHLDPWFRGCMEETQILMRQIFQTENRITFPLSASGSGGGFVPKSSAPTYQKFANFSDPSADANVIYGIKATVARTGTINWTTTTHYCTSKLTHKTLRC